MKVVQLCGLSPRAGGLFYAQSALCRNLHANGVDVSVFGDGAGVGHEDLECWNPVAAKPYRAVGPLRTGIGLRRTLADSGADVLHQNGIWLDDQWAALQWQKKTDRPVVVSPHGMLDPWALRNAAWKKRIVEKLFAREALERASCIHALCRAEAEAVRSYGLKNPVAIIPNGVDLPGSSPQKGTRKHKGKRLLFLGRIHPKKGLKELVGAWGMEHGAWRKDWKLLVAGWDDGNHEQGLKELVGSMGISDSVEFVGSVFGKEKEQQLRSVDAFVLPSFSEGLPMSVLEAWSHGLPVMMTDFCNLPEGFDASAAVRIEPNIESIAQGLETLASLSGAELDAMGSNGRSLVESKFTWPRIAADMQRVYEWCLTGTNPPDCLEFQGSNG